MYTIEERTINYFWMLSSGETIPEVSIGVKLSIINNILLFNSLQNEILFKYAELHVY